MFNKYFIIALLLIPPAITLSTKVLVDHLFSQKSLLSPFFYNNCEKIWGHRGYFKNHDQNSLKAINEAIELGAKGVEIDIYYDTEMNNYVVSHDLPYNMKENRLLLLDNVFSNFGNTNYYWLDFKNLNSISKDNIHNAILKLTTLANQYETKDKIIIESTNAKNLLEFSKERFNTSYWISFDKNTGSLNRWKYLYMLKIKYILGYFSAISMDYRNYTSTFKQALPTLPVLLFTVNEKDTVEKLIIDDSVKIILSDENYYHSKSDACIS